jgi:peptidoglycan/xylan/chitin deacetylase (PgdA/CDA1 family)
MRPFPVLCYHAIFDDIPNSEKYALPSAMFETEIRYLYENGFRTLVFDDLLDPDRKVSDKNILITFDDGNLSDYSLAFPILRKYGFVATSFVTVSRIGTPGHLSWENLEDLRMSGISIQSHSLTHPILPDLDHVSQVREFDESRRALEERIKTPVRFFSLPGGNYSKEVIETARALRFRGVCTSAPGLNSVASPPETFQLFNRFVITRKTSFEDFKAIANGDGTRIMQFRLLYQFKIGVKQVIGKKRYHRLWSLLFKNVKE